MSNDLFWEVFFRQLWIGLLILSYPFMLFILSGLMKKLSRERNGRIVIYTGGTFLYLLLLFVLWLSGLFNIG